MLHKEKDSEKSSMLHIEKDLEKSSMNSDSSNKMKKIYRDSVADNNKDNLHNKINRYHFLNVCIIFFSTHTHTHTHTQK